MRVLRYALKLTEFPYLITGSEEATLDNDVNGWTSLTIKVTVPEKYGYNLNTVVPQLLYDEEDKDLGFCEHYREILFGKHPDWYLYSCEVTAHGLVLNYYNREVHKSGSIVFENIDSTVGLQLAVPHKNGKPDSVYDVSLHFATNDSGHQASVIEYYENGRRELSFREDADEPYTADKYVYIDEYVDL